MRVFRQFTPRSFLASSVATPGRIARAGMCACAGGGDHVENGMAGPTLHARPTHKEEPVAGAFSQGDPDLGVRRLLQYNRRWAEVMRNNDPTFFESLAKQQSPKYFWLGCSDSRVPANQIMGLAPGEVFVHRNIANVVAHGDLNCLSVTQYAVDCLHVEDVMVVGHYRCGGVGAALSGDRIGIADNWVRYVKDVRHKYREQLWKLTEWSDRLDLLCELNVIEQTYNISTTTVLTDQWEANRDREIRAKIAEQHPPEQFLQELTRQSAPPNSPVTKRESAGREPVRVHGWVYDVADGILHPLLTITFRDDARALADAAAQRQIDRYLKHQEQRK